MEEITFDNFDEHARACRFTACEAFLRDVRRQYGASALYLHGVAILHNRRSEFRQALAVCEEITHSFPEYPNHRYVLAACAAHLGELDLLRRSADLIAARRDEDEGRQVLSEMWQIAGLDDAAIALAADRPDDASYAGVMVRFVAMQCLMRRHGIAWGVQEYGRIWCDPAVLQQLYGSWQEGYWGRLDVLPAEVDLHYRGGAGDYFMWVRYASLLGAAGVTVHRPTDPTPRVSLRADLFGWAARSFARRSLPASSDLRRWTDPFALCTMLFPLFGHTGIEDGYLRSRPHDAAGALLRLARERARGRPCVGLFWSAGESHTQTFALKSLALAELGPLLDDSGDLHWVVCQRGFELAQWQADSRSALATTVGEKLDWSELAAVLAGLDAVVSMDTGIAHLAAALGLPTLVLLPSAADWRWENHPSHTAWYPRARLFRQPVAGDWATPLGAARSHLAELLR